MATYTDAELIRQMNTLQVPAGCLAIWGLGQMGVALKGAGPEIVYIDPCLSNVVTDKDPSTDGRFDRAFPPPLAPRLIDNATYVLCSHEHWDHTDSLTLGPLAEASPTALFVSSGWAKAELDEARIDPTRRITPSVEQPLRLGPLTVHTVPAAHYTLERDEAHGERWLGFVIEWNGVTFYHSGDTLIYPGYIERMKSLPQADVAMLAVNGRDAYRDSYNVTGNLLPAEAAWLCEQLGWDLLLGGHNDLYLWNTIAAGALADALRQMRPRQKTHALQPGELYLYVR